MADRQLVFHPDAAAEYEATFDWYFERSSRAALKFAAEVEKALDIISEAPHRWPLHIHGTRKFLLWRFPFAVIYRETTSSIQIIAIAHGRRRPGYWKARLSDVL